MIDSQLVRIIESAGSRGFDAGQKVKGRKRHIFTDTEGNLPAAGAHTTDVQGREQQQGTLKGGDFLPSSDGPGGLNRLSSNRKA